MEKISLVVITKNEEKNIEGCLTSAPFADEMIVVDSGSRDATVKISKRCGAKVFFRKWSGYADQKNFGISKARNEWVLSIDADERVSQELHRELRALDFKRDGYLLPIRNIFLGKWLKYGGQYPDLHLRLFRRSKGLFKNGQAEVHEGVHLNSDKLSALAGPLIHYSYENISLYFDKLNRYTNLDAMGRFRHSKKPSFYGVFLRPPQRFIKWYIIKLGILDGMRGLLFHMFSAFYCFVSEIKLLELYRYDLKALKWRK